MHRTSRQGQVQPRRQEAGGVDGADPRRAGVRRARRRSRRAAGWRPSAVQTEIRFLEELEEDLLGAASLEEELAGIDSSAPRPRSPRKVVRGRRRTVRTMSLAAAAAVL